MQEDSVTTTENHTNTSTEELRTDNRFTNYNNEIEMTRRSPLIEEVSSSSSFGDEEMTDLAHFDSIFNGPRIEEVSSSSPFGNEELPDLEEPDDNFHIQISRRILRKYGPLNTIQQSLNLPTRIIDEQEYTRIKKDRGGECEWECSICLMDYEMDNVIKTMPCFHEFHEDCIDDWLGRNNNTTCPMCRACVVEMRIRTQSLMEVEESPNEDEPITTRDENVRVTSIPVRRRRNNFNYDRTRFCSAELNGETNLTRVSFNTYDDRVFARRTAALESYHQESLSDESEEEEELEGGVPVKYIDLVQEHCDVDRLEIISRLQQTGNDLVQVIMDIEMEQVN